MTTRNLTILIISTTAALLLIYDLWIWLRPPSNDTISEVLAEAGKHPMIPFLFGLLIGHWFWPVSR